MLSCFFIKSFSSCTTTRRGCSRLYYNSTTTGGGAPARGLIHGLLHSAKIAGVQKKPIEKAATKFKPVGVFDGDPWATLPDGTPSSATMHGERAHADQILSGNDSVSRTP